MNQRALSARPQADHEHVSRISTGTILFLITAAAVTLYELQLVLIPFVIAGVISYICAPAIAFVSTRSHAPRLAVAIFAFLILVALGAAIGLLGIPPLAREIARVATHLQETLDRLAEAISGGASSMLGQHLNTEQLAKEIGGAVRSWIGNARVLSLLAGGVFVSGFGFVLMLVLLFFFMISGPSIVRGLMWLVPPGERPLIEDHILLQLDPVLRRYFIGVVAVVCFAAAFAYAGLGLVLGIPHAVFLALVTGLLEAIPIVGPAIAAAIAGLVALQHNSGLGAIIGYAAYLTALRLSIDQLFGPLVLGAAGRVHPALVIFCFLAGGTLFGVVGVITAVPIALIIKTTLSVLYDDPVSSNHRHRSERKETTDAAKSSS
ncbi:AI-2E family transporter [Bradyrhizobium sp.]|uniref:AI-2E family transporter n=1 Tax=Bradyrhizobium sp. TaxID=376 RepID=UPI002615515E|nr:AI-2E family transporter [Bradyrhizobium sp.]